MNNLDCLGKQWGFYAWKYTQVMYFMEALNKNLPSSSPLVLFPLDAERRQ